MNTERAARPEPPKNPFQTDSRPEPREFQPERDLDRKVWRIWGMVVGVLVLTTLVAVLLRFLPGTQDHFERIWPWAGTDRALVLAMSLVVLVFAVYLTRQQHQVMGLRRRLEESRLEANQRTRRHCEHLCALLEVSHSVAMENDPQTVFDCITDICLSTFDGDQVSLMLFDQACGEIEVRSAVGHGNLDEVQGSREKLGEAIAGWVARERKPLLLGGKVDPREYPGLTRREDRPNAAMVVPIVVRNELVGVLNVSSRSEYHRYSEQDLEALRVFAENAGIACRHAEQTRWMRETIQHLDQALTAGDEHPRAAA